MNVEQGISKMSSKVNSMYAMSVIPFGRYISVLIFILLLGSVCSSSHAQSNTNSESLELRVVTLEQQFDAQVLNVLSNYFDTRKYFVDISIDARFVDETYRTTENQIIRSDEPKQEDVMMPGLPFIPEGNMKPKNLQNSNETTQTIINEQTVQRLQILGLRVNIYADSSITAQQAEFMKLIAGIAAKINESRGDAVNVTLINMPDFGIDALPPATLEDTPQEETLLGSIKDYIPGFVLLLLIGLTLLIGRLTQSPSDDKDEQTKKHRSKRADLKQYSGSSLADHSEQHTERNESSYRGTSHSSHENGFSFITDQFLNHSKDVALLFEYWMENDIESGAKKAANVVSLVDRHLLKALKGNLSSAHLKAIDKQISLSDPLSNFEKQAIAKEFTQTFNSGFSSNGSESKYKQLGLFQFMDHLKEHHIVQLLQGEGRGASALLVDYLPEETAARVMEKLGKDRTVQIMLDMTKLHKLSYKHHKAVSSRLFSKAMDILEVEKEMEQGSDNILRVLQQLPLEEQSKYIEQLKSTGSPVAEVIANQFITIDQIPSLDDSVIKDALTHIPTEILLEAATDFEPNIVDKLLSVRPKREQRLIRMELQQMGNINKATSEHAKLQIMHAIRKALK